MGQRVLASEELVQIGAVPIDATASLITQALPSCSHREEVGFGQC